MTRQPIDWGTARPWNVPPPWPPDLAEISDFYAAIPTRSGAPYCVYLQDVFKVMLRARVDIPELMKWIKHQDSRISQLTNLVGDLQRMMN